MRLEGIAAIVTGGASGLGAATATLLAARGAKVTLFDMNADLGRQTAAEIGGGFQQVNVADEDSVVQGLDAAEAAFGTARLLVNCAGVAPGEKTVNRDGKAHSIANFRRAIEINLIGTFTTVAHFAARASKLEPIGEERGVIVNTASIAAFEGQIGQAAYASSKAGVAGMTLPIARDLAPLGIRVVTIAPGLFLTPMMKSLPVAAQEALGNQTPFPHRLGDPNEYAMLVESIVSNPFINGETIRIDGAVRLPPK